MFLGILSERLNELESVYAWWACILILQTMALTWYTGRLRVNTKTIHSEEDRMWLKESNIIIHPNGGGHPDVDRIRSVHLHDIKIIVPFLLLIPVWLNTKPNDFTAKTLLRLFSLSKILDTIISVNVMNVPMFISLSIMIFYYCILFYISADLCWFYLLEK